MFQDVNILSNLTALEIQEQNFFTELPKIMLLHHPASVYIIIANNLLL